MASQLFWHNIYNGLFLLSSELKKEKYNPDVIIGVGRGGLIPATLLAYKLNVKNLFNFTVQSYTDDNKQGEQITIVQEPGDALLEFKDKNILVVDDLSDTGNTLQFIIDTLKTKYNLDNVKTLTLCIKEHASFIPDFYLQKYPSDTWLTFPWEVESIF
jgi:hypoxanthine phosphoribosyltransferase